MELERFQCPSCEVSSRNPGACEDCEVTLNKASRCAWCVQWSETSDYCSHCGSLIVLAENFFAARVLKSQGVNQLSINLDLDKLEQEKLDLYRQQYEVQKSIIEQILDAVGLCQSLLFFDSYSDEFSRRLIKSLPLSDSEIHKYQSVFKKLSSSHGERLVQLAATTECPDLMQIAVLALVRCTDLLMDSSQARSWYEQVTEFAAGDSEYVFEALISLGHWRTQLAPFFMEQYDGESGRKIYNASYTKLHTADGIVAQWMAVVCARTEYYAQGKSPSKTRKLVKKLLNASLQSDDQDLRIASAMLLGDTAVLSSYIDSTVPSLQQVSISVLARQGSEKIIPVIVGSDSSSYSTVIDVLLYNEDLVIEPSIANALLASLDSKPAYVDQIMELLSRQKDFQRKYIPGLINQLLNSDLRSSHNIELAVALIHYCSADKKHLFKPVLLNISQDTLYLEQLARMSSELEFGPEIANNINRITRKFLGQDEFKLHAIHLSKIYQQQLDPAYASGFMYLQFLSEHLLHQSPNISNDIFLLLGSKISELLMLNRLSDDSEKFSFSPDLCETCFGSLDNFVHAISCILQQPGQYQCESWLFEVLMNSSHEFRDAVSTNIIAAQYLVASLVAFSNVNKSLRAPVTQYISAPSGTEQSPLLDALSFDNVNDALLEILKTASRDYIFPRRLVVELLQYYEIDQRPEFIDCIKVILVNQCSRKPQYAYIAYAYLVKAAMDLDQTSMANDAADILAYVREKGVPYQSVKDGVAYAINDLNGVVGSFFESGRDFIEQAGRIFSAASEMAIESWLYDLFIKDSECVLDLFSNNSQLMATLMASLAQSLVREKYSAEQAQKSLECLSIYIEHSECYKQIKNDTINTIKIARETGQLSRYTLTQVSQFYSEIRKHCANANESDESKSSSRKVGAIPSLPTVMPAEPMANGFEVSDAWLRKFSKALTDSSIAMLMPVLGHFHNHSHEFTPLLEENSQVRIRILDGLVELLFTGSGQKEEHLSQRLLAAEIISTIAFNTEDAAYCISRLRNKLLSSNVESRHDEYVARLISTLSEVKNEKRHGNISDEEYEFQVKRTGHVGNMTSKLCLPEKIEPSEYSSLAQDQRIVDQVVHACELAADGDFITSVKVLKLALRRIDSDVIYYLIARVFIMHDLPDQATRYLQQCLVRNPSNFSALELYTSLQEIIYHDYSFAIELAKRILELKPDSVSTLTRLGSISIRLGDYANATRYIQQAMKVDSKSPDIYFQLGEILFHTQRFREAINNYKKAASCGKRDGETYTAIAQASLMVNDRDTAMRYFKTATEVDDNYDQAFYGLGRLFRKNKEYKSADFFLTRAVELDDRNQKYSWELALTCKERGEKSRAFVLLESIANSTTPNKKVFKELAELCMEKASWYEAQDYYEKSIATEPDNYVLYFSLAKSYEKTESWGNAVGILQRAIDIKPDFTDALRMSARIYFDMERYPQAQEFYQRVLKLDVDCQISLINMGRICNLKGDFREAADYLIISLKRDNNNAVAHCYYATTLAAMNEYKKSTKHFEKAVELDPEYADAYVRLGNAYYHIENFTAAAENYSRGAAIDPEIEGLDDYLTDLINHLQGSAKAEIASLIDTRLVKH